MSSRERQDKNEQTNAPKDGGSPGISRDEEEAIDKALQAESETDAASASASDADAGGLKDAADSE